MPPELSEQRKFVTPRPGEDWKALAARALPDQAVDAAIQSLKSWNLQLFTRMPPGEFLGCDVVFVEPPRQAGASIGSALFETSDGG